MRKYPIHTCKIKAIFSVLMLLLVTACVDSTTQAPAVTTTITTKTEIPIPSTPKVPDIIIPPEPTYPIPYETHLVYFANDVTVQQVDINKKGALGNYSIFLEYPNNLKNKEMQATIKSWINEIVDEKLAMGFPKYPGILRRMEGLSLSKRTISVYIRDTINNIMEIGMHRYLEFSNGQQLHDTDTYYLDILTGQQISLNHIMNSDQGLEELNQLVMLSYDVFVEAEDVDDNYLYVTPFRQAFLGLPDSFNLRISQDSLSIELDEHCSQCNFPENHYFLVETPTMYNIKGFSNSLYERHYVADIEANATPGQWMFNQGEEYSMFAKQIEVNEQNQLVPIQAYDLEVAPYLIERSNELLEELQPMIADAEKQLNFRLADVVSDSYIRSRIFHGRLLDTVYVDYNIRIHDNVFVTGSLSRNYHPITHNEVTLKDLFVSGYQYKQLVKDKFTWLLKVSQSTVSIDTLMAQFDHIDYEFQQNKLILHTYPYQGDTRKVLQSLKVEIPIEDVNLDIFTPFWK